MRASLALLGALAWSGGLALAGDGTTFQEQAARLQNINAYLLDLRPASAPDRVDKNRIELILDINPQPTIDTRVGRKDEPLDPPSFVPKIRARWLGAGGLAVGGAYAPGIEFQDYEAEYVSLELGYRFRAGRFFYSARASYADGDVTGPITELDAKDFFTFRNYGLDLSVGRIFFDKLHIYAFLGGNDIETTLDIELDGVRLENTDEALYGGVGAAYRLNDRIAFNFEQNVTDDYLAHLIFSVAYRF